MHNVTTHRHHKPLAYDDPIQRVRIPCPFCAFQRLIDTGQYIKAKTLMPGDLGYYDADFYQKCAYCKEEIGIKKIE